MHGGIGNGKVGTSALGFAHTYGGWKGSMRGKVTGEGAFDQSVVEEPVVRAIITKFEWRV